MFLKWKKKFSFYKTNMVNKVKFLKRKYSMEQQAMEKNVFNRMGLRKFLEPIEDIQKGVFNQRMIAGDYNWIFGHLAFILTGSAFLSHEIITLREKAVAASICTIIYSYYYVKPPLKIGLKWSFFYLGVNTYFISRYFWNERFTMLDSQQEEMFADYFGDLLSKAQFKKILKISEVRQYNPGHIILKEGQQIDELYYIFQGKCVEQKSSTCEFGTPGKLTKFGKDRVLGDFIFITGKEPISQYNIEVVRPSTILAIDRIKLEELISKDKDIGHALYYLFASELINKLHIDDVYGDKLRSFRKKLKFLNVRNKLTKKERRDILEFREKIDLDMKYFEKELDRVGWTFDEFENREKVNIHVEDDEKEE